MKSDLTQRIRTLLLLMTSDEKKVERALSEIEILIFKNRRYVGAIDLSEYFGRDSQGRPNISVKTIQNRTKGFVGRVDIGGKVLYDLDRIEAAIDMGANLIQV